MTAGRYYAMSDPALNPNFGRRWGEPDRLGDVTSRAVDQIARQTIKSRLRQAQALDGEKRNAVFWAADEIRREVGLDWSDILNTRPVLECERRQRNAVERLLSRGAT